MAWLTNKIKNLFSKGLNNMNNEEQLIPMGGDDAFTAVDRPIVNLTPEEQAALRAFEMATQAPASVPVQSTAPVTVVTPQKVAVTQQEQIEKRRNGLAQYWEKRRADKAAGIEPEPSSRRKQPEKIENTFINVQQSQSVFFVEGKVRYQSTRQGGGSQEATQNRIVYAENFQEAIDKYTNFFAAMNNKDGYYTVIGCAVSEAIK